MFSNKNYYKKLPVISLFFITVSLLILICNRSLWEFYLQLIEQGQLLLGKSQPLKAENTLSPVPTLNSFTLTALWP
jgi:hypothetical protein